MQEHFSTAEVAPAQRRQHWTSVISRAYFDLDLQPKDETVRGSLSQWDIGRLRLSRLVSSAVNYRRRCPERSAEEHEQFLVSLPLRQPVRFSQVGREALCLPGQFVLERSEAPYDFSHEHDNELLVLKIPGDLLRRQIRQPERYCALALQARNGLGGLFAGYLQNLGTLLGQSSDALPPLVEQQLLELLGAAVENEAQALDSRISAVRAAHLQRIERYALEHLTDPQLDAVRVAQACRISPRYLHDLFGDTQHTFAQWLRTKRLEGAYRMLLTRPEMSIAQIAYAWGFADQSHFCRLFKQQYGCPPRELRRTRRTPNAA